MRITPEEFQQKFIYSQARHPAFVGSWSTGKTMCAIMRSRIYSKGIPENMGVIFRKTERSLFDSTLKDFERYTCLKVNSHRNFVDDNKSITMFRHLDEIDDINKQNINLGWFYLEQGDELDSDREFFMLFGRLRRHLTPTKEFLDLQIPIRSGWVIANAGDHWMKPLWKDRKLEQAAKDIPDFQGNFSELIEATYKDNIKHIPADTIASWQILEKTKPEIYRQFVLNDWNVSSDQFLLIKPAMIELLKGVVFFPDSVKKVIACDPATGGDECVLYILENGKKTDERILHINDTMKIAGEMVVMAQVHSVEDYAVDAIGIGKGIADRLSEMGKRVNAIQSAAKASDSDKFYNLRTEMWWYAMEQIQNRKIEYIADEELRKQLCSVRYKVINSNGKIQLEPKDETKKRLGRSPDRADAFIYGLWTMKDLIGENYSSRPIDFSPQFAGGRAGY